MSIEERLSKSILYNLNILRMAVRTSDQLDEVLTEGIFLKSSTQAFIHVTHYLFNIIDAKEFRKKFYWPIVDKKSENSYRTSSVEFINMIIDRHSLQQEKIKQVTVVHPSGKKFMSLMLDLILIAIKEVMRRKRFNSSKSMDIDCAMEMASTINQVENDLMSSLRADMRVIRERTQEIQAILTKVFPGEQDVQHTIHSWHSFNVKRMEAIRESQARVIKVVEKAKSLQSWAEDVLSDKKFAVMQPSAKEMEDINEFYQLTPSDGGHKLSIVSLIRNLQSTLPIILNYVGNFSYDQVEVSDEEMKIVSQLLVEVEKLDSVIGKMRERESFVKGKLSQMRAEKEREKETQDSFAMDDSEDRMMKEAEELESLRVLLSPRYHFDASKNCTTTVLHKRNHLAFAMTETEDENVVDRSTLLSQSRFLQVDGARPNTSQRNEEMGPPKLPQALPSRRRRRDAMQLLEQATSKKCDINSTKFNGDMSKAFAPLSSTLLSPDLIHHANFNFSMLSTISSVTPIAPLKNSNMPKITIESTLPRPDVLRSNGNIENLPWTDTQKMKQIQKSPVTKVEPLVSLEDAFGEDLSSTFEQLNMQANDETLQNSPFSNTGEENETVCENESYAHATTVMFGKKSNDKDLFTD